MAIPGTLTPLTAGQMAAFVGTPISAASVVFRDKQYGGNFLLRAVSSLTEAAALGGVLFYDTSSGHSMGLIGGALRQWVLAGSVSPKFRAEFGHRLNVADKAGFRRGLKAAAHLLEYNKWHLEVNTVNVQYCAIITDAETGFLASSLSFWQTPFFSNPIGGFRVDGLMPTYEGGGNTVDGHNYAGWPYGNTPPTSVIAFVVSRIPYFESMKSHLNRVRPYLRDGLNSDALGYLDRAWNQLYPSYVDGTPVMRTLWFYRDGAVYHGPGGQRVDYGKFLNLAYFNKARDLVTEPECATFNARSIQIADSLSGMEYRGVATVFQAAVEESTNNFHEDFRADSHRFSIMALGPAEGVVTLPCLFTINGNIPDWTLTVIDYPAWGGAQHPKDRYITGQSKTIGQIVGATDTTPGWCGSGGEQALPTLVSMPANGLVGTIGTRDAAELHRSQLVGQYMLNDGSKRTDLRVASWQQFMLNANLTAEGYSALMSSSGDTQVDLAALKSRASAATTVYPAKVAWQAWGPDIFDNTQTFCDQVMDLATEIAVSEN